MAWGVAVDEAMFLGGKDRTSFLAEYSPGIFFDDRVNNCVAASRRVATGHVRYGINNECQPVLH